MTFNIGDKVRLKKFKTIQEYRDFPNNSGFNSDMATLINEEFIISEIYDKERDWFLVKGNGWAWDARWFKKVGAIQLELFE